MPDETRTNQAGPEHVEGVAAPPAEPAAPPAPGESPAAPPAAPPPDPLAELQEAVKARDSRISELDQALKAFQERDQSCQADLAALQQQHDGLTAAQQKAVEKIDALALERDRALGQANVAAAKYRAAVLAASPGIPEELVPAGSVEQVDGALEKARGLVARVRQAIEAETALSLSQGPRVPAGAPGRSAPDLDSLSPREKISLGLKKK